MNLPSQGADPQERDEETLLSTLLGVFAPQGRDQAEEPIRYEDFDEEDLPRWPGQWRNDEVVVRAPEPVVDELRERFGVPFSAVEGRIRRGQYVIRQQAQGLGQHLDRGMLVIMLPTERLVLWLRVNFSWDGDGRPLLGILGLREIDPAHYTREDVLSLAKVAQNSLSPEEFHVWYDEFLHRRPACSLRALCSRDKAKARVLVRLPGGEDVEVGIIGSQSAFARTPVDQLPESQAFWTWLDGRIRETKDWAARVKNHRNRSPQGDQAQLLLEGAIDLSDIQAVRICVRRGQHPFDFLLWERK